MVGLLLGLADANHAGEFHWTGYAYFLAGVLLGYRHAGRSWPCWPPLGVSLYVVHIAAIACGYQPPYVERDFQAARETLQFFFPAGAGIAVGASLRLALTVVGWSHRKGGPPVRFLPSSTRGVMATVAEVGITLGLIRWIAFDSCTIYSAGYHEGRFHQIRAGMTSEQVESMMGRPIQVFDWPGDGMRNWVYTRGAADTSNYWRRWVMMKGGKVAFVVSDFWWD